MNEGRWGKLLMRFIVLVSLNSNKLTLKTRVPLTISQNARFNNETVSRLPKRVIPMVLASHVLSPRSLMLRWFQEWFAKYLFLFCLLFGWRATENWLLVFIVFTKAVYYALLYQAESVAFLRLCLLRKYAGTHMCRCQEVEKQCIWDRRHASVLLALELKVLKAFSTTRKDNLAWNSVKLK